MKQNNLLKIVLCIFSLLCSGLNICVYAQFQNNGSIYVADTGSLHIGSGSYNFGSSPASTKTSRGVNYGVISFGSGIGLNGLGNSHYVDGFARLIGSGSMLAPVGDGGFFAPIVVNSVGNTSVDVSFNRVNPSALGVVSDNAVTSISSNEFWRVNGTASVVITLSWRTSSNVYLMSTDLSNLTVLGFNGTNWVAIPSAHDATSVFGGESTVLSGSITTTSVVNLSNFSAFAIGSKSCHGILLSSGNVKTWNGSWSPNPPTIADPVVINAPFNGSLSCYSVVMNSNITLSNSDLLEVVDSFVCNNASKVIMSSEASLVQYNASATPPAIQLTKVTNPMRRYDYVFLSSPINDIPSFFAQLRSRSNVAVDGAFDTRPFTAFQFFRTYQSDGLTVTDATPSNTPIGRGFSASVLSQAPYSTSTTVGSWYNQKFPIHIKTVGVANNGNYTVTLPFNGWARVGNPYPSAISGEELLNAFGPYVRKTLYFWTFNTPRQTLQGLSTDYNNADFAYWNYSGGIAACATCQIPTGKIATMQSVMIRSLSGSPSPLSFDITNCMRLTGNNNNFFRSAASDKFWLNLTGSSSSFSQMMLAYSDEATNDYDNGYDSVRIPVSGFSTLSSLIGVGNYAIQTRSGFDSADVVPLNITNNSDSTLTISLFNPQGTFSNGNANVYLHDKYLSLYHNLSNESYSFVMPNGSDSERFEIVYSSPTLDNNDFAISKAIAVLNEGTLNIQSTEPMEAISIFDITGRKIYSYSVSNSTVFNIPFYHPQAVYIVKINMSSGKTVSVKLMNQ